MSFSDRGQGILKWVLYVVIILAAILGAISITSGFIMDYYWFNAVGYLQVFMKNIRYQLVILFAAWFITVACLFLTWRTLRKALPDQIANTGGSFFKIFSVFIGFGVGWWFKGHYFTVLKFLNQSPWGVKDPVFSNDISFYVFTIPMVKAALSFVAVISGIILVLSFFTYGLGKSSETELGGEINQTSETNSWEPIRFLKSWPILGSIIALTIVGAAFTWLGRFSYLWQFDAGSSIPSGASYMAVHYLIPYTWVRVLGVILIGILTLRVLLNAEEYREYLEFGDWSSLKTEVIMFIAIIIIFVIIPGGVFGAINTLNVQPNEPGIQEEYLERTINSTRQAYNLDGITKLPYGAEGENALTSDEALASTTVKNARIVDYRPLTQTYREKQRLRLYYEFHDVDVDRYQNGDEKNLAIISGREIDIESVPTRGGEWQNRHLIYTHGFGAVLSPANRVEPDGTPVLTIGDIPPVSNWDGPALRKPRIYFGERTDGYALVGAEDLDEFDYPMGGEDVYNRFIEQHPDRGIEVGNLWKRLVSFFYTGDLELLVSNYIGNDSRLLLHRNVHNRVQKIAPFLSYDSNAHIFLDDEGGLNFLLNGITQANNYPYSYTDANAPGYLSDSVKSFVKASSGEIEFYMINDEDPMVQTFSNIYPNLFEEQEMPQDYRDHIIYPNDLFDKQMEIYRRYHMDNPRTFYQQEDLWSFTEEIYHGQRRRVEAYNILYDATNLPSFENNEEEYMLVRPFTPRGRNNLVAWVGVGQDGQNYGRKVALVFPSGKQVQGPRQVEAIIDQTEEISRQISLWSQRGSSVLRGNLLALPVKDDILYIEPLYLEAEDLGYPQLRRVIAVYEDRAAMDNNLERAVLGALGERVTPGPAPGDNMAPTELVQVVQKYLELREEYQRLYNRGEYAAAGEIQEQMADVIENMRRLLGS